MIPAALLLCGCVQAGPGGEASVGGGLGGAAIAPDPDALPLEGTSWEVDFLRGWALTDTPPRLRFDGTGLSGSGGCNTFSAQAARESAQLSIGPVAATRRVCPGPVMAVELAFFSALQGAAEVAVLGDRLHLRDAVGQTILTAVPGE